MFCSMARVRKADVALRDLATTLVLGAWVVFAPFAQADVSSHIDSGGYADHISVVIQGLDDKAQARLAEVVNLYNLGIRASSSVPKLISMLSTERNVDIRM